MKHRHAIFGKQAAVDRAAKPSYKNESFKRDGANRQDIDGYEFPRRVSPRKASTTGASKLLDNMHNPFDVLAHESV